MKLTYKTKKKKHVGLTIALILLALLAAVIVVIGIAFNRYYNMTNYVGDEVTDDDSRSLLDRAASRFGLTGEADVYNLLLVGVDRRDDSWNGNSDSMILLSINRTSGELNMISFMRDLKADIPGYGTEKLNAACAYGGCPLLVETIEQNFDINIDNYAMVDFNAMIHIVDCAGGVTLNITPSEMELANGLIRDMANTNGEDAEPHLFVTDGEQTCDGYQAVAYSRIRHTGNSDYQRTERQRNVLQELFVKIRGMSLPEVNAFAEETLPYITHDIESSEMLGMLASMTTAYGYTLNEDRIPYDGLYTVEGELLVPDMDATIEQLKTTIYH